MIPYWLSRTQLMLGDEKVESLMGKNVLIVGLGGVGGICAEMIVRAVLGRRRGTNSRSYRCKWNVIES